MISKDIVFKVFISGRLAFNCSLTVWKIVQNNFFEVKWISCSEENIFDSSWISSSKISIFLGLFPALTFSDVIVVAIVFWLFFCATFPFCIAEFFILRLLFLVNCNLNGWVGGVNLSWVADNFANYNSAVDLVKQFYVFFKINGSGPLVSDSEDELGKEVLIHHFLTVAIVEPFLSNLILHLCFTIEWCKESVNAS